MSEQRVEVPIGEARITDDPEQVDRDAVWAFLSTQAYWGRWRSRAQVESQLDGAWRVVSAHVDGHLVGFARAVSDGVGSAYLADVFVLERARGLGIATAMLTLMIEQGPGSKLRWMLHTSDAHGLYERLGFGAPDRTYLERPARR